MYVIRYHQDRSYSLESQEGWIKFALPENSTCCTNICIFSKQNAFSTRLKRSELSKHKL
jgi:hypothetical protein